MNVSCFKCYRAGRQMEHKNAKVNEHLKELCRKYNFFLIDDCKFIKVLNKSGIHLNKKGSTVLGESFNKHVESLFN